MPRAGVGAGVPRSRSRDYAVDLTFKIERTLVVLADVEARYKVERERVDQWDGPVSWKDRVRAGIEARHARDRQPLAQRLADLQREIASTMALSRASRH